MKPHQSMNRFLLTSKRTLAKIGMGDVGKNNDLEEGDLVPTQILFSFSVGNFTGVGTKGYL